MRTLHTFAWPSILALILLLSPVHPAAAAEKGNHSFWKIDTDNGSTLYLLGSIHFLKKEFYPLDPVIENAFKTADIVVFETDIAGMSDPAVQVKTMMKGMCPPGKSLKDYIAQETYDKVKQELGPQIVIFDKFKPWMVAMTLVMLELQKLGFNPENGVDQYFHRKAVAAKKQIEPLETIDFQLGLFFGLGEKEQESFLIQTMKESSSLKNLFQSIVDAWKSGNEEALDKLIHESMRDHPDLLKKFLTDRNQRWIPQLQKLAQDGKTVFAVVGAGHLVGTNSVVDLFRKSGTKTIQL